MDTLIVDCERCTARPRACSECVISALLGVPGADAPPTLSSEEQQALGVFADAGLLPPLRLVEAVGPGGPGEPDEDPEWLWASV